MIDADVLASGSPEALHEYLIERVGSPDFQFVDGEIELELPAGAEGDAHFGEVVLARFPIVDRWETVKLEETGHWHALPEGWNATLCALAWSRSGSLIEPDDAEAVTCPWCLVRLVAIEIVAPAGPSYSEPTAVKAPRAVQTASRGRSKTDLYLDAVEQAVAAPGRWINVRTFNSKANADVTGRCLEGGYLRVTPRSGEPEIHVNGNVWLRTAAPIRFRVGSASDGWPLDVRFDGSGR
jgi:hypothetical protein